ncbi:MAG: PilZ domain-containing protein [Nitrospirales bacterium]
MTLAPKDWDWDTARDEQYHRDRFPLLRPVPYETTTRVTQEGPSGAVPSETGMALSVNVSSGGMCLLMNRRPSVKQVLRVQVPMPVNLAQTPTLAEVRWVRQPPFSQDGVYLVGLKFLL